MPTIDEELVANSKAKFNADVNVKDFSNVKTEDGTTLTDYIDEHGGGSVPENMVTTDTEQVITGHKYIGKASTSNNFITINGVGTYTKFYSNQIQFQYNSVYSNYNVTFVCADKNDIYFIDSLSNYRINLPSFVNEDLTLATTEDIKGSLQLLRNTNATNIGNNKFKIPREQGTIYGIMYIVNSSLYTSLFFLPYNVFKTSFTCSYGTTSDDVATCFAYIEGTNVIIDLDNIQGTVSNLIVNEIRILD